MRSDPDRGFFFFVFFLWCVCVRGVSRVESLPRHPSSSQRDHVGLEDHLWERDGGRGGGDVTVFVLPRVVSVCRSRSTFSPDGSSTSATRRRTPTSYPRARRDCGDVHHKGQDKGRDGVTVTNDREGTPVQGTEVKRSWNKRELKSPGDEGINL